MLDHLDKVMIIWPQLGVLVTLKKPSLRRYYTSKTVVSLNTYARALAGGNRDCICSATESKARRIAAFQHIAGRYVLCCAEAENVLYPLLAFTFDASHCTASPERVRTRP
jgi:hypothetical protein